MGIGDRFKTANQAARDKRDEIATENEEKKRPSFRDKMAETQQKQAAKAEERSEKVAASQRKGAERIASAAGVSTEGALFVGTSHDDGRNAVVTLFPDRIERVKAKKFTSMSKAHQDVEVTPVKAVSSVQAKKDGMLWTKVTVYASGNNIDFKFAHDEAARFKDAVMALVLGSTQPTQPAAPTVDVADQLTKLAALRDQGVLTDEEFSAQKAKLLG
jgi:hypothetical protein